MTTAPATYTGVAQTAPPADDPKLPSYVRPEALAVAADLELVHHLLAGTRTMWQQAQARSYIRKWKDEEPTTYEIRRKCETVFGGLDRTLSAATGMLFAKPPQMTWNQGETVIGPQWQNVDGQGTAGQVFAKRFADSAIRDGLGLILVDHPPPPVDANGNPIVVTSKIETLINYRPTWAMYARGQVLNWRTANVNNQKVPVLVVLHEQATVDDGDFGSKTVDRYRVLRIIRAADANGVAVYQATWRLLELQDDPTKPESYVPVGDGVFRNRDGLVADRLPIAVAYAGRTDAPFCATIPLLGVAWANLAHWQISTNLRFYRDLSAFPQPTIIGDLAPDPETGKPTQLKIGPMAVVHVVAAGSGGTAEFKWTELAGSSMVQLQAGVQEKLVQMAQLGMSFLAPDTRAAETAEAKRLDAVAENSTLATAAQGIEDALNMALEMHAWYVGIEKAHAPTLALNREYESTTLDAGVAAAYAALVAQGFPKRIVLEALQVGGWIAMDKNLDELELEWEANVQAAQKQKELAAAAQIAKLTSGSNGSNGSNGTAGSDGGPSGGGQAPPGTADGQQAAA